MGNPAAERAKKTLKRRKKLEKRLFERDLAALQAKTAAMAPAAAK